MKNVKHRRHVKPHHLMTAAIVIISFLLGLMLAAVLYYCPL